MIRRFILWDGRLGLEWGFLKGLFWLIFEVERIPVVFKLCTELLTSEHLTYKVKYFLMFQIRIWKGKHNNFLKLGSSWISIFALETRKAHNDKLCVVDLISFDFLIFWVTQNVKFQVKYFQQIDQNTRNWKTSTKLKAGRNCLFFGPFQWFYCVTICSFIAHLIGNWDTSDKSPFFFTRLESMRIPSHQCGSDRKRVPLHWQMK